MPSTEPTTLTIAQLDLSPWNCRTNAEDKAAVGAIAASILQRGLIHPLQVHRMRGSKTKFGVFAGGRRYRAHKQLIEAGELPAEHGIAVIVHDATDAELIELSLAENLLRRDLRPYEEVAAVRRALKKGHTPQQIADALGQRLIWVERHLRLADLAEPVWKAFEAGTISMEQAKAFGATGDQAAQHAAWDKLRGNAPAPHANVQAPSIRQAIGLENAELDRLLLYVGEEAYRAAGGAWDLDLFAGDAGVRGKLEHPSILRALGDAKLDAVRASLRKRAGRDVRFQAKAPLAPGSTMSEDWQLSYHPPGAYHTSIGGNGKLTLPDGVIGVLKLDSAGKPQVDWWWENRSAKFASTKADKPKLTSQQATSGAALAGPSTPAAQAADAQIKAELGGTRDTVQAFRSIRRAVMRAALLDNARAGQVVGADLLAWSQCRILLAPDTLRAADQARNMGVGQLRELDDDPALVAAFLPDTKAHELLERARRELVERPWAADPDMAASFRAFRREPADIRALAAAYAAGAALHRSVNADGYQKPLHDELALQLDLVTDAGVRRYWTTTKVLLRDMGKMPLLQAVNPFVTAETVEAWHGLKLDELADQALRVVTGKSASIRKNLTARAGQWVHQLLRFGSHAPPADPLPAPDNDAAELAHAEAAE